MNRVEVSANVKNHLNKYFFLVFNLNMFTFGKFLFSMDSMKDRWKYCLVATFCALPFSVVNAQTTGTKIPTEFTNGVQIETQSLLYNAAYLEISDMLDGKQPLSIKRAVFLAEWAYLDGKLDYEKYCNTIDSAADFIKRFIRANAMEKYKTAKNMALIEYFFTLIQVMDTSHLYTILMIL